MLLNFATKIFGSSNERVIKNMRSKVEEINALEPSIAKLSDDELKAKTQEFRSRIEGGATLDSLLPEAFAVVREASKRVFGMRHFDVQLIGGITLHQGKIAEMRTGEGKTLMATLPVYLNAISGKGVHVVTVNDYLAKRDSEWMGKLYNWLGLSIGCIVSNMPDTTRQEAYAADITYGTNNEFGFDYLRDNMKYNLADMAQREFNYAIVDEVDSILVDEARTPLIISGPTENATDMYMSVNKLIPLLAPEDYEKDEKAKTVILSEAGVEKIEELLKEHNLLITGGLYDAHNISLVHHVNQALRAHKLFSRDTDYIVKDDKVIIIDEFTGRMMDGRRYSEGLHQALEAKEGVTIQNENQTLASITFQNYFRLYPKLAGMTGTAMTEASEFMDIYKLGVVEIPTNVPVARIDENDKIYKSAPDKERAIIELIKVCHARKQPVLVGTVSIEKSEALSESLKKAKIPHQVLNARYHEQEASIISQAGRSGAVTIATNMAGRGTDIKLGGNAEMRILHETPADATPEQRAAIEAKINDEVAKDKEIVLAAGGLYVIGTERHESRRIDNQLRGRSGRQGDPGASTFFLSTQDDLMRIFSPDALEAVLSSKSIGLKDGEALTHPWLSKALEKAQTRVEQQNYEIRKNLLKYDNVMNDQRKQIYEDRHEIMNAESISDMVNDMRHNVISDLVNAAIPENAYAEQWDVTGLKSEVHALLNLDLPIEDWAKEEGIANEEIEARIIKASDELMAAKRARAGDKFFDHIEKSFVLRLLDQSWKEHLLHLDHLRQGINLRAFAQRDPLNEYKSEAFNLFNAMTTRLSTMIVQNLSLVEINTDEQTFARMEAQKREEEEKLARLTRTDPALESEANMAEARAPIPFRKRFDENDPTTWMGNVPRNSDCPCGSGKKFKYCHGKID
ncbi:MAG: preprotein translocase subunit SecA [Alphaproteobacteria bacterium RIFCSPHIGHO2_12_FULL_45_9]|nr:MAG: preprotein translocase subunit SecA [Alphaproteobacteria bacterium RIFCSPHIGHO2_02_FULL_46_13]OFW98475.1 MAG: preprotein translocase subunit SecA [Alphaproteobacteria bacterium RIFCSPHIGHO2_12_FULL_45_9]